MWWCLTYTKPPPCIKRTDAPMLLCVKDVLSFLDWLKEGPREDD